MVGGGHGGLVLGGLAGAPAGEAGGDARGAPTAAQVGRAGGAAAAVASVSEQVQHGQLGAAQLPVSGRLRSRHPPLSAQTGSWKKAQNQGKDGRNSQHRFIAAAVVDQAMKHRFHARFSDMIHS